MKQRNTIQRTLVLEAVREMQNHVTADEVYEMLAEKHSDISRGTVYRNLNLLSDMGKIRKLEIPGGADRYDHLCHEHYHARCLKCTRIFDMDMAYIEDLEKNIKDTHGFEITGHDVIFKGVCPACNQKLND